MTPKNQLSEVVSDMIETVSHLSEMSPSLHKQQIPSPLKNVVKGLITKHSTLAVTGTSGEVNMKKVKQKNPKISDEEAKRRIDKKRSSINLKRGKYKRDSS